ncbi:hypothetical protein L218DRAFT_1079867 [Marasmius fiardii PR-910]|nr:hypothetical protein L218DRAFT_1079867 [Marasmius fiardii PR-910]
MVAFNLKLFSGATVLLSWVALTRADSVDVSNGPGTNLAASFRVLATIPNECQTVCDGVVNSLTTTCATIQCVCNATATTNIHTCVDCLIAVKPGNQTVINQAQEILNQYALICNAGGVSVPFQTASGFTGTVPTAPPPTAPPATRTGTSTGTGATISPTGGTGSGSGPASSGIGGGSSGVGSSGSGVGSGGSGGGTGTSSASTGTGTAAASNGAPSGFEFGFGSLIGGIAMGLVIGL